jgi:uncharacterized membrane protein
MMNIVKEIQLDDGPVIYVETEKVDAPAIQRSVRRADLPPGAVEASVADKAVNVLKQLHTTLGAVVDSIQDSVKASAPDEWGAEINIGFKGEVNPIPVIVGSESSIAIKIHVKWVKATKQRHRWRKPERT